MQYCKNCKVQIRGRKARCPLCQRELMTSEPPAHRGRAGLSPAAGQAGGAGEARAGGPGPGEEPVLAAAAGEGGVGMREALSMSARNVQDDDPFVYLPAPRVSYMFLVRVVTFVCVSLEILFGAAEIIIRFRSGWPAAAMLISLVAWADFMVATYYRNNLIRMLTTEAYILMAVCLAAAAVTRTGAWAVSWAVPGIFLLLIAVTFAAARAQGMQLHEFILYPAFDMLMCLLQIVPIALGRNPVIAPAVICIALMLILGSSLVIFRGRMLREAAAKYLHL